MTFVFYSLNLFLIVFVWYLIARRLRIGGTFFEHFQVFTLTDLAKRIPGTFWYIAGRMLAYERHGTSKSVVALGSALEAILLIDGAIVSYLLVSYFGREDGNLAWWLLAILGLSLVLVHPRVVGQIVKRRRSLELTPQVGYGQMLGWLLIYVLGWIVGGITVYWWLQTLTDVPGSDLPQVISAWVLAGALSSLFFFSPGGFGIREISLTFLLSRVVPMPVAIVAAISLRILLTGYQLVYAGLVLAVSYALKLVRSDSPAVGAQVKRAGYLPIGGNQIDRESSAADEC